MLSYCTRFACLAPSPAWLWRASSAFAFEGELAANDLPHFLGQAFDILLRRGRRSRDSSTLGSVDFVVALNNRGSRPK